MMTLSNDTKHMQNNLAGVMIKKISYTNTILGANVRLWDQFLPNNSSSNSICMQTIHAHVANQNSCFLQRQSSLV